MPKQNNNKNTKKTNSKTVTRSSGANPKNNLYQSKKSDSNQNGKIELNITATLSEKEKEKLYKKYNEYVEKKAPKTKTFPTLIYAFIVGGFICMIGQGIVDALMAIFPTLSLEQANTWMLLILIFLASFLTAIGVYDKIGAFAGAGSVVPITGFSNSITSPAVEFKREGIIYGLCVKMFTVAGPVIVNGLTISLLIGLVYYFTLL